MTRERAADAQLVILLAIPIAIGLCLLAYLGTVALILAAALVIAIIGVTFGHLIQAMGDVRAGEESSAGDTHRDISFL